MDLLQLKKPFRSEEIEWRMQQSGVKKDKSYWGMCLAYVQNRAIMDRLDDVCGPGKWRNEYKAAPEGGILCGISIFLALGNEFDWVTKWDGASNTDIEAVKGGLSNAMKRAAVQWGVGRYLYGLESGWAIFANNGKYNAKMKDGSYQKWNPPQLPEWALPSNTSQQEQTLEPDTQAPGETFLDQMKWYATHENKIYRKVLALWKVDSARSIDEKNQVKIIEHIEEEMKK